MIRKHGGRVSAEAEPDKGATGRRAQPERPRAQFEADSTGVGVLRQSARFQTQGKDARWLAGSKRGDVGHWAMRVV